MKKASFLKRLLCLMLIMAIMAGYSVTGYAVDTYAPNSNVSVSFTKVDNSEVSATLSPLGKSEETNTTEYAPNEMVRVSILLKKASTIEAGFSTMNIATNEAAITYRENLKKEQTNMVHQIEKVIKTDLDVVWNLTLAANIISANVEYGQIAAIEKLPGVDKVLLENQYLPCETQTVTTIAPHMATSGSQIGTAPVWAAGYTGAGSRIAVIDTGIDTDHQSMHGGAYEYALAQIAEQKGMTLEEYMDSLDLLDAEEIAAVAGDLNVAVDANSAYFNSKLPFVFNYKDLDYDVTHDNDDQGDHGSHVAGIATANSYIIGQDGNYYKALDTVMMQGVAPDAQLLALKVFGKSGSPYDSDFFAAIEDAIVLGADSINLSLGSTAPGRSRHSNAEFQEIMDNLSKSGVVVAISAGNSGAWVENAENGGYLYNTDVSMDTLGQPGSFTNSLCVASVENDGMVGYYFTVGDEMIVYIEELFNNMQPYTSIAGEHEYIFIDGVGKAEDWAALADVLPGKVAICSRGETNFTEKARLAVEAGAIAVLIYNNQPGITYLDMTEYYLDAPVASLTMAQGAIIRENSTPVTDAEGNLLYLTGTMNISNTIGQGYFNSAYYTMSDFSSWGVTGSLEMKPEITAPGGNIYSLEGLNPTGGAYAIKSGTSMASPQVAGMAALLAQYITDQDLIAKTGLDARKLSQSLLMSTAEPILAAENNYFSILQQGAGLANISAAVNADSYIIMADDANGGAADGKVKVELFDDPDRVGAYSATFTIYNLEDAEKSLNLGAQFFIQDITTDGTYLYMDTTTANIPMNVTWYINSKEAVPADMAGMDFNGDGLVNADDGQTLLDYATGLDITLSNENKADIDDDGDIDSHDAYEFLRTLGSATADLPAGGSAEITVEFALPEDTKDYIDEMYPNGTYIQGYLFAETEEDGVVGTSHSIPVLGFFGNWSDPSMFDVGLWPEHDTGDETRMPYIGRTRANDFKVRYKKDPGYHYSLGGNPLVSDSTYMPERNAINSADTIHGVSFVAIRHADQSRVSIVNETTGEIILEQNTGAVNMAYFYNDVVGWQNSGMILETTVSLKNTSEDDVISMDFTLVPEYYVDREGNVDWDALGAGATISTSMVIDNTAPELFGVSVDLLQNTMTITASDNNYIAAAGLYNKTGTRVLARTGAKQDIEKGEVAEYTFSLDGINGKKFLVQVFDYAMNVSTYLLEMQIGEDAGVPDMIAYDMVQGHWTSFTKDYEYDYKVGTPRLAYADFTYTAGTIAEHYVFASTSSGDLYVMPEDDLSDITFIVDMGVVLYDMAYNKDDGEIYAVTENNDLVAINKLTGELSLVGKIPFSTNTLACSEDGVFYCNELGTGNVWYFTLRSMNNPQLLIEDLTIEVYNGYAMENVILETEGYMAMEYDPNKDIICWTSHYEFWGVVTFAYYFEIDPTTGEYTCYNDLWHEMTCLMIPDNSGRDDGWASPTDEIFNVQLNKYSMNVIKGTTSKLVANVQPWTATNRDVTWTSSDESVATVDETGLVTGIAPGVATITATSNLDPTKSASCEVTVELLQVTINGTVTDEAGLSSFYSWNMATDETWTAGNALPMVMTSATYSYLEDVFYMMDTTDQLMMHKVDANGNILASAENVNSIPLWDMVYSPVSTELYGKEMVTSIYYTYLLSPKDPMALDAVGFDLSSMCNYLVGITSMGYEQVADEEGTVYNSEHVILLDNSGYVWDFWMIPRESGDGYDALYSISKSNLECTFPGDDTMEHMYTSMTVGEDGNLYLSTFNGKTNELYHMSYDQESGQYVAVLLGDMGNNVWPATITSVTVNSETIATSTASPAPTHTMSSTEISNEQLAAASKKADHDLFGMTAEQIKAKLDLISAPVVPYSDSTVAEDEQSVTVEITNDIDATNGVVTVSWDADNLTLTGIVINGDYTSKLEGADSITFGYVAMSGIPAGETVATLIFDAVNTDDTSINIEYKEVNNGSADDEDMDVEYPHTNTEIRNAKDATCTEDGYTGDTYCADCGKLLAEGEVIEATGHTEGEVVIENEVEATCTEDGSYDKVTYCTECDEEVSRETITVPATGHTEGEVVIENEVEATCTEDGSYDKVTYCTECDKELSRETVTVPATGHSYVDGVCEHCGQADPDYEKPVEPIDPPATGDSIFTAIAAALISMMGIVALTKKKES